MDYRSMLQPTVHNLISKSNYVVVKRISKKHTHDFQMEIFAFFRSGKLVSEIMNYSITILYSKILLFHPKWIYTHHYQARNLIPLYTATKFKTNLNKNKINTNLKIRNNKTISSVSNIEDEHSFISWDLFFNKIIFSPILKHCTLSPRQVTQRSEATWEHQQVPRNNKLVRFVNKEYYFDKKKYC